MSAGIAARQSVERGNGLLSPGAEFMKDVLAGSDFFTVEVLTWRGLATCYVLFFIHLESRRVSLAGITRHPPSMDVPAKSTAVRCRDRLGGLLKFYSRAA